MQTQSSEANTENMKCMCARRICNSRDGGNEWGRSASLAYKQLKKSQHYFSSDTSANYRKPLSAAVILSIARSFNTLPLRLHTFKNNYVVSWLKWHNLITICYNIPSVHSLLRFSTKFMPLNRHYKRLVIFEFSTFFHICNHPENEFSCFSLLFLFIHSKFIS